MADVVLFQPALGYWEHFFRDFPLGLLAISRYLGPDLDISIVDGRLEGWQETLAAELRRGPPLLFGVTAKTGRPLTFALEAAAIARRTAPGVPIVWGGIHPTLLPEQTLAHPLVDVVVAGEAEETFRDLVLALRSGSPDLAPIPGLWLRANDGGAAARYTGARRPLSLNHLPALPYRLIRWEHYRAASGSGGLGGGFLETGRGCRRRCAYCYAPSFHAGRWRPLKAEGIVEGIEHLKHFTDVRSLFFVDDSFFTDLGRVRRLAGLLADAGSTVRWRCEGCADDLAAMTDGDLALLARSGCDMIALGVESGSERIRRMYGKELDAGGLIALNRRLPRAGITAHFYFMMGYLGETDADLAATTDLVLRIIRENPRASVQALQAAVPYPGTAYLDRVKEAGYPIPGSIEEWAESNPQDWIGRIPWLDERGRRRLRAIFLASNFTDDKVRHRVGNAPGSLWLRIAGRLYRPLARLRLKHRLGTLPLEVWLFDAIMNRRYLGAARRQGRAPAGDRV